MNKGTKIGLGVVFVVFAFAVGLAGWFFVQKSELEKKNQELELAKQQLAAQVQALKQTSADTQKQTTNTTDTAQKEVATDQQKETIKAALSTMNTQPLVGYMAPSVEVVVAASEGMPAKSPDEAVRALDYFKTAKQPWDFNLGASVLSSYGKSVSYGKYFGANTYVGKAASGQVVAFHFGANGKIDRIFMAVDDSIF